MAASLTQSVQLRPALNRASMDVGICQKKIQVNIQSSTPVSQKHQATPNTATTDYLLGLAKQQQDQKTLNDVVEQLGRKKSAQSIRKTSFISERRVSGLSDLAEGAT